jgi:DNA-binding protein Fis
MTVDHFNQLKGRLEALRAGTPPPLGVFERARMLFVRADGVASLEALRQLDAELERAGVHTVADARLLRELGTARGRLGELSKGLEQRAAASLAEFELALAEAERRYARAILERCDGNQSAAARALGISRNKLARLLRG